MIKKIEILAPAGSYEGMKAAMNAGCDAVYIGGTSFGARAYADNLGEDTLLKAIDEAHTRNKNLYLTVNTLLKERELTDRLYNFLEKFYLQGLDAVIVQDVGVMHFIHEHFPLLPIHASTQMTLTMAQGANLLKGSGVTRLVTARELSFKEIKEIRENTDLEIETFVHGALCYCYSGQCLMSSMIGGRSGNRGRCAQPCRMPYQFYNDQKKISKDQEKYLLSPKDIMTIEAIPDLVEAGIDSFKIEGRMKRPEYAAIVSYLYRKYVDFYLEQGRERYSELLSGKEYKEDMIKLQDIYNRGGFSAGYGKKYHGKSMMSMFRPNHSGVYVGEVCEVKGRELSIKLEETIHAQDILEIRFKEEEGYEFTVKEPHKIGAILKTIIPANIHIPVETMVYRTKNNELMMDIAKRFINEDKKLGIKGKLIARLGERLALTLQYQDISITAYQDIVPAAVKQPMTREKLAAPLEKTGDTLFFFEQLEVEAQDNIFVPVAWLNEIRRTAIELFEYALVNRYRRNIPDVILNEKDKPVAAVAKDLNITVLVQTVEQFEAAVSFPEVTAIYADYDSLEPSCIIELAEKTNGNGKSFYLSLPHICRLSVYNRLEKDINLFIENNHITGFLSKNFEETALLQSLIKDEGRKKEIILNYTMYVYNREAKSFWQEKGITSFTAPVELNFKELRQLGIEDCSLLVYGHLPLMVSAQCLYESTAGCRKSLQNNRGFLTDRLDKKFYVQTNCKGCFNTIYNGQPLALFKQVKEINELRPNNLRLDFTKETIRQTKEIIKAFIDTYLYGLAAVPNLIDYTTGHFKRGVE